MEIPARYDTRRRTMTELEQLCADCKAMHEDWDFDDDRQVVVKCDTCIANKDKDNDNSNNN